jgi:hypothetical protein
MLFIMLSPHVMMILYMLLVSVALHMLIREEWHYSIQYSKLCVCINISIMRMPHGNKMLSLMLDKLENPPEELTVQYFFLQENSTR